MFPHRYPRPKPRNLVLSLTLLAALGATAFLTSAAADHGNGNTGTVKVHDGAAADPPTRNEPHVTGGAFVEGFNMAAHEGTLNFFAIPPTGDGELVLATTWEDDGGEPESHFLAGPFDLPCGHYRVEAQNGLEEDDFPGGVKSKMFWVEPCEGEEPVEMECPADLAATPNEDGSILLTFTPAAGSDGTNIYRAVGDGDFEYVATVGPDVTEYLDETTTAGSAYAYTVTALYGDQESTDCPVVEVTAIPVFPTALGFALATVLGAGAYLGLALRRRKE